MSTSKFARPDGSERYRRVFPARRLASGSQDLASGLLMVDAAAPAAVLVLAAEAIGFMLLRNGRCGFDERRGRGEIGDAMMGWPVSCLARGGAVGGNGKQRDGQNKAKSHRGHERNAHFNLLSSKWRLYADHRYICKFAIFDDLHCIAIALLRRPRLREIYSKFFKRFCCSWNLAGTSSPATTQPVSDHRKEGGRLVASL